jgi:RecB family exonuclease
VLAGEILAVYVPGQQDRPPPLAVEFPFEIPLAEHVLSGVVDRIDEGEAGLTVVELKTGRWKPSPKELRAP